MTHEREPGDEPEGGPPLDERLPNAIEIPVTQDPGAPDDAVVDDERRVAAGVVSRTGAQAGARAGHLRVDRERNRS